MCLCDLHAFGKPPFFFNLFYYLIVNVIEGTVQFVRLKNRKPLLFRNKITLMQGRICRLEDIFVPVIWVEATEFGAKMTKEEKKVLIGGYELATVIAFLNSYFTCFVSGFWLCITAVESFKAFLIGF